MSEKTGNDLLTLEMHDFISRSCLYDFKRIQAIKSTLNRFSLAAFSLYKTESFFYISLFLLLSLMLSLNFSFCYFLISVYEEGW